MLFIIGIVSFTIPSTELPDPCAKTNPVSESVIVTLYIQVASRNNQLDTLRSI